MRSPPAGLRWGATVQDHKCLMLAPSTRDEQVTTSTTVECQYIRESTNSHKQQHFLTYLLYNNSNTIQRLHLDLPSDKAMAQADTISSIFLPALSIRTAATPVITTWTAAIKMLEPSADMLEPTLCWCRTQKITHSRNFIGYILTLNSPLNEAINN